MPSLRRIAVASFTCIVLVGCAVTDGPEREPPDRAIAVEESPLQTCSSSCTGCGDVAIACSVTSCSGQPTYIVCDNQVQYCRCAAPLSITASASAEYASNEYVTFTANVPAGGPYTYTWKESWCRNGTAPGDCNGSSNTFAGAQTISRYVSTYDWWLKLCVTATDTSCTGTSTCAPRASNTSCVTVSGDGTCPPNKVCPV